ncbi:MAG: hypothetical protein P9M00_11220 [Candidatus Tritonobacter lacicola]|nr:hypothetical protein [Candidatus Tritonobacter lacicola]
MNRHRRIIFIVTAAAIISLAAAGWTQTSRDAGNKYREAYIALQDAIKLNYENRKEESLERYEEARDKLRNVLNRFPDTNRETIEARIANCEEAIEKLKMEIQASSPHVEPPGTQVPATAVTSPPEMAAKTGEREKLEMQVVKLKREAEDLKGKLETEADDLKKARAAKAALQDELEKARSEKESMMRDVQNLNTSLGIAISDIEKEQEAKAMAEEEAINAHQASEEVLKTQLISAIADMKKIKEEALEACQASEEIMRDMMDKQKQEHTSALEEQKENILSGMEAKAQPIDKLQVEIETYRKQVETARKELDKSLELIASSQQTHKKLLDANKDLEKRITDLSRSVSATETEAELTELRNMADAEEERLKKPDITRGPSLPKKVDPSETRVLAGAISEKKDEYGKVFIDFVANVEEGTELVVIRDDEVIAKVEVSKVFPSINGGIAKVIPKEDAYEIRMNDKVFDVRRQGSKEPL